MNNLKKVGLTALGTALVASSAYAGDFTATGGASITFVGHEQKDTNNGWSMGQEVSLSGSSCRFDISSKVTFRIPSFNLIYNY